MGFNNSIASVGALADYFKKVVYWFLEYSSMDFRSWGYRIETNQDVIDVINEVEEVEGIEEN